MARPVMRNPTGKWSLAQVHTQAGVTLATARRVTSLGWLDAEDLSVEDVVVLQVAATLLDAPRPDGGRRAQENNPARDRQALALTRSYLQARSGTPDSRLIMTAETAVLTEDLIGMMNALNTTPGVPVLLLPLGAWVAALPTVQDAS